MPAREVFNVLTQPDGTPIENAVVEIRLVANTTTQRGEGFVTSTQESILWRKHVSTDADGRWEANLQPNSEITPDGTVYLISEDPPGRAKAEQHYISVPDTAGPHWLYDILTEAPASLASSALELHRDTVKDHDDWSDSAPSAGQVPIWNGSAYVPGDTVATDVEAAALVIAHNADTTDVHGIPDTSALMVEGDGAGGVLSGTYPSPGFAVDMATQAELDSHISDATAAHAASAISVTPTGGLAADDVQEALSEHQTDIDTLGAKATGMGYPHTFPWGGTQIHNVITANNGYYIRNLWGGSTCTKLGVRVLTSSGNISLAVYANTGSGQSALPSTRRATTGAVACPAAGVAEVALDASTAIVQGDWLALSADNTTAAFDSVAGSTGAGAHVKGMVAAQATAHPLPATATPITTINRMFVLWGAP